MTKFGSLIDTGMTPEVFKLPLKMSTKDYRLHAGLQQET